MINWWKKEKTVVKTMREKALVPLKRKKRKAEWLRWAIPEKAKSVGSFKYRKSFMILPRTHTIKLHPAETH